MDRSITIVDAKAAFLRKQVRLLSHDLQPSTHWREFAPEIEEASLSDKAVKDAVSKVNDKIKHHHRMVYSAPSQRHVAEQIDTLYSNAVTEEDALIDADSLAVSRDTDLTTTEAVEALPDNYNDLPFHTNNENSAEDIERFAELRQRLVEAAALRDQQRKRLEQYKQLQALMAPFENAQENVQPNLVTKDGELGKELDRMRMLLARVTGRIADMKETEGKKEAPERMSNEQKLATVMDLT